MLVPSMGDCWTPLTMAGSGSPAASRMVGARSMTWVNCERSPPALVDLRRPVHDGAVAGAAPVRGHLLGPLEGGVHRPGPPDRVVVVGVRAAEVVHLADHELGGLEGGHPVEVGHLVERAVDGALGRGAVVADDVVHQRVLQDAEVLQGVDQPADVVVGVLQEPGVDLHLAGQHRLQLVGHVLPGRDLVVAAWSARHRPGSPRAPSAGRRSARAARPSRRRTGRRTCRSTPWGRGAVRGLRPGRSTRRTACPASAPSAGGSSPRLGR